jgi:chaperonin cofactor prefoldin
MTEDDRKSEMVDFEDDAEVLFVQHLDLLAQLEAQLRAVHHTMRRIERLRGDSRRVGPELANGERESIVLGLAKEIDELDLNVAIEHECCRAMHTTIGEMQQRVATLKRLSTRLRETRELPAQDDADHAS